MSALRKAFASLEDAAPARNAGVRGACAAVGRCFSSEWCVSGLANNPSAIDDLGRVRRLSMLSAAPVNKHVAAVNTRLGSLMSRLDFARCCFFNRTSSLLSYCWNDCKGTLESNRQRETVFL